MYELYYSPGACSLAVHVVLNELGQDVTLIRAKIGDPAQPDSGLAKVNPRGQVPVLVENGGAPMREGGAIITYLCDQHPSSLLPASGPARARALQWLMFCNASLHPAYSRAKFIKTHGGSEDLVAQAQKFIQDLWDQVEAHLAAAGTAYLAGDDVTAGDILLSVIANWRFIGTYEFGPKTQTLLKNVSSRPAYQKALEAEGITYKAVA